MVRSQHVDAENEEVSSASALASGCLCSNQERMTTQAPTRSIYGPKPRVFEKLRRRWPEIRIPLQDFSQQTQHLSLFCSFHAALFIFFKGHLESRVLERLGCRRLGGSYIRTNALQVVVKVFLAPRSFREDLWRRLAQAVNHLKHMVVVNLLIGNPVVHQDVEKLACGEKLIHQTAKGPNVDFVAKGVIEDYFGRAHGLWVEACVSGRWVVEGKCCRFVSSSDIPRTQPVKRKAYMFQDPISWRT